MLEELKTQLLLLDTLAGQFITDVSFDEWGNIISGRDIVGLYNSTFEAIEHFLRDNPGFDYSHPKHKFNTIQYNNISYIANIDRIKKSLADSKELRYYRNHYRYK